MAKYAKFYKCALQVNPYTYLSYRGKEQQLTEEEYNNKILEYCLAEDIQVVGLADHGSIQTAEKLRSVLTDNGIHVLLQLL